MSKYKGKCFSKVGSIYIQDNDGDYIYKSGEMVLMNKKDLFKKYQREAHKLTNINSKNLNSIELRDFNTFHIDHKISIYFGFNNNIDVRDIAHISNLEITSKEYNINKRINCTIDINNKWILEKYKIENK